NGTLRNGAPVDRAVLVDEDLLELGHTFFLFRAGLAAGPDDPPDLDAAAAAPPAPALTTLMPALAADFRLLDGVARSTVSVVIHGESGTGKELVAQALHQLSGRPGPFVAVNCGALPETLVETELFGYRKGAFSGAVEDRPGLVRSSDKGTLLLDEIGSLPLPAQAALLRVLQEEEVVPVGATRPLRVNLRVVAATHEDLGVLASQELFRADLLARLSGFTLDLPPVRERREDVGLFLTSLL